MATKTELEAARKRKQDQLGDIAASREAQMILEHPVVTSAFEAIEGHYLRQILHSDEGDVKGREMAFRMIRAAGKFKQALTSCIEHGSIAEFDRQQDQYQQGLQSE